jgi:hypothetical protein
MIRTAMLAAMALALLSPREAEARGIRAQDPAVIGGRPSGCPRAFCGCGASLYLFGHIIPRLNLAAAWLSFPRALPAPRTVAVRRHHVFVLEQHLAGALWLVHDSNSGGHLTRRHARSIAGYAIVDPGAAWPRWAAAQ